MHCYNKPRAIAYIKGDADHPTLQGTVRFYQKPNGVLLVAQIRGLPPSQTGFFGFHIHQGERCAGEAFSQTQSHYNPKHTEHPSHAGDLPPLLSADRNGFLTVLTNRFTVNEVIGRTVVIHSQPDDFTTPPAGNAGTKIACGVIKKV